MQVHKFPAQKALACIEGRPLIPGISSLMQIYNRLKKRAW